ncbi:MAG: RNA methyltransferase [Actinobacteria bacterium 21-64-8]|nr:MAG: RNA methyltransferase [Actinobacteria bacterium 21-64-8]
MACDEKLAGRVRVLLASHPGVSEKRMFDGVAFLVNGHIAVAASSRGGLMVRINPSDRDQLFEHSLVEPMEMGGRIMKGWLRVKSEHLTTKRQLEAWIARGVAVARSLPAQ